VVIDIMGAETVPTRAEGEHVTPPPGLPEVTLNVDGEPSLGEVPPAYRDVTEMTVQPLIIGEGRVVTPDDFLTVHYTGWFTDGQVFDSSWARRQPTGFPLSGVIQGWTQGLSGQTIGSQVLLIIPPDLAYGEAGQPPTIPGGATLIFVVDILSAN
jgi:peptidylprolyl isomerase